MLSTRLAVLLTASLLARAVDAATAQAQPAPTGGAVCVVIDASRGPDEVWAALVASLKERSETLGRAKTWTGAGGRGAGADERE